MHPDNADRMANSVDQACLSENLGTLRYFIFVLFYFSDYFSVVAIDIIMGQGPIMVIFI